MLPGSRVCSEKYRGLNDYPEGSFTGVFEGYYKGFVLGVLVSTYTILGVPRDNYRKNIPQSPVLIMKAPYIRVWAPGGPPMLKES